MRRSRWFRSWAAYLPSAPPRSGFERRGHGVEHERDGDRERDVGEHACSIHALGKMDDAVAEPGKRCDRLAAEDRKQRDREPDAQAAQNDRGGRRQQHEAEQLVLGGPHRARGRDEDALDIAEARDRVEDDRKEARGDAERDLRCRPESEEQDVERQEQNNRHRIDAGEQRLEHAHRILRAADEIAERDAGNRGDRKSDREFDERDAQIADELERPDDVDELVEHVALIGQQDRADLAHGGPDPPGGDQHDDEGDLNAPAREPAAVALRVHAGPPLRPATRSLAADCSIALRISSCSSANNVLRSCVNFSEVMKLGLRGCGSSIAITSLMVPGRAENTATRSARKTASPRLWVTNTMVFCVRERSTERSSPSTMRVCSSRAPNGSSISRMPVSRLSARASAARWRMPPESWPG